MNGAELLIESDAPALTHAIASRVGGALRAGDVVRLYGELGAGKTAFVRGIAHGLGIDISLVISPTYTLAHEYIGAGVILMHIDAYRITDTDALSHMGDDAMGDGDAIVCIEWPERLAGAIDDAALDITLEHVGEEARAIRLAGRLLLERAGLRDALARMGARV